MVEGKFLQKGAVSVFTLPLDALGHKDFVHASMISNCYVGVDGESTIFAFATQLGLFCIAVNSGRVNISASGIIERAAALRCIDTAPLPESPSITVFLGPASECRTSGMMQSRYAPDTYIALEDRHLHVASLRDETCLHYLLPFDSLCMPNDLERLLLDDPIFATA